MQQRRAHELRGGTGRLIADGNGFEVIAAVEIGGDAVEEILDFNLGAVQM